MNSIKSNSYNQKDRIWIYFVTIYIIIIFFRLNTPFDLSDNSFFRLFTTSKIAVYMFLLLIIRILFTNKFKTISKIPGKFILFLLLISFAYSTMNAENI